MEIYNLRRYVKQLLTQLEKYMRENAEICGFRKSI